MNEQRAEAILVVEDRPDILDLHTEILQGSGYDVTACANGEDALGLVTNNYFDLLVLDDRLPGMSGRDLLRACREYDPDLGAIFVSAFSDAETLTDVIRLGATDYLSKPASPAQLKLAVKRALEATRAQRQWRWFRERAGAITPSGRLIGESPAMKEVQEVLHKVAPQSNVDILLTGETGTGKEAVARELHRLSPRKDEVFLDCNLGGLSRELIASELFGHTKGSFTGATEDKTGYFEAAHRGTLFLDEIGEMPLSDQTTLLRVIETREVTPVGSTRPRKFDARLVAATNRNLWEAVDKGEFRRDLLSRLDVVHIHLRPLRERLEDIEPLTIAFVEEICEELGRPVPEIPPKTFDCLRRYHWPENVRELRNTLKRTLVLNDDAALAPDLLLLGKPLIEESLSPDNLSKLTYEQALLAFEQRYLSLLLEAAKGNKSQAARLAAMDRSWLYEKLRRCGLLPDSSKGT